MTDKILKGFFFKTSLLHSRVPPFYPYVSFSLSQSAHVHLLARARKAKRKADQGFFWALRKGFKSVAKSFRLAMQTVRAPPIKKYIRVIRISTREVSVSEGGTFEK